MNDFRARRLGILLTGSLLFGRALFAAESAYLYGIFDGGDPSPADASEYLGHISSGAGPGWVTCTIGVGANTNDAWGVDFRFLSNTGHTVICRINHGYFPNGTIPLTNKYDDFAVRCSNFVAHSQGCFIWTIGNELNISGEWPYDPSLGKAPYVTPSNYALCYRKVYNAIKAVHPNDKVLPEAPACFAGPYGAGTNTYIGTNYPYDPNPINWVQHLNQVLTAITNTGPNPRPPDGIALHVASRGYACSDIHSSQTVVANGQTLSFSFNVYKDWVNLGIPPGLYNLPLYATECNGYYFWKGGTPPPEDPNKHYEAGWMQEVYAEINRYNQAAMATGKPVFHCFNMYQWPNGFDGWNIDGEFFKPTILTDLDEAVAQRYVWPVNYGSMLTPIGFNFIDPTHGASVADCDKAGVVPMGGWNNLTAGGGPSTFTSPYGDLTITWSSPGGGTHWLPYSASSGDYNLMLGYLDTSNTSTNIATISGVKFPLYDVIVYCDGDNGATATRVGKYSLSNNVVGVITKYVRDDFGADFSGSYTEVDSSTGGPSTPAGNYCRFRNIRGGTFMIRGQGEYASDGNPRGPLNAIQIVPANVNSTLTDVSYSGGQIRFTLNGASNANYIIQVSTNLLMSYWTAIRTSTPGPITDPSPSSLPNRFYRALFK
ncbi:MAG: hypothetical protein DME25_09910 [Verrucomicrobia bacterium]|nr:MAG: hypothetical protein DME25_09910 [Verrucomicrobiota bacterium]